MITSEEIKARLWDGANELRGSMDASRYKDYMLGLMFYKFLSDKTLETFAATAGFSMTDDILTEYENAYSEYGSDLATMIQDVLGYFVLPEYLYQRWIKDMNSGDFEVQKVTDSLNSFERTIAVSKESDDFKGLFSSSTLDLTDTALGSNLNERSKNIKALIRLFEDLDMVALQKDDVLGDAYEYLIGQFAMESGKKAGEFYTPRQVSEVMAQIIAKNTTVQSIYDPTVGSGSLLLTVKKHLKKDAQKDLNYYGQERNTATYNLTRMNMILHGVRPEKMSIKNGDTLSQDWPEDPNHPNEGVQFDAVVMNPPYSLKNWNKNNLKISDPRFEIAGVLPPDSKGEFAFLLHGLYHLGQSGTMAIVLPHGVLSRGGTEREIRKRLIEKNQIDAVIGLPANLFKNTGIPVCVLILKKNRQLNDPLLLIDASKSFIKVGKQNTLQEKDIAKIVDTYSYKQEIEGYSHLATREELIENDYNLKIPLYVEEVSKEIPQDVDGHLYGGIPEKNIQDLHVLHHTVGHIMEKSFTTVRPGYLELNRSMDELTEKVLSDENVQNQVEQLQGQIEAYISKYWNLLHQMNTETDLSELKESMLVEIKELLIHYPMIDHYMGYQIVAEIWEESLARDTEVIALSDFYNVGRMRERHIVEKTKNKVKAKVQDGWTGTIIPNELIVKHLYVEKVTVIDSYKARLSEIEAELTELLEAAKVDENEVLYDVIKKDAEGEPQDSFETKKVKSELKNTPSESPSYELLNKVHNLHLEKSKVNKQIKKEETELKEVVYERILYLTDEEIDKLLYDKWFGKLKSKIVLLIEEPLKAELATISELSMRYHITLQSMDEEIMASEQILQELLLELVVD